MSLPEYGTAAYFAAFLSDLPPGTRLDVIPDLCTPAGATSGAHPCMILDFDPPTQQLVVAITAPHGHLRGGRAYVCVHGAGPRAEREWDRRFKVPVALARPAPDSFEPPPAGQRWCDNCSLAGMPPGGCWVFPDEFGSCLRCFMPLYEGPRPNTAAARMYRARKHNWFDAPAGGVACQRLHVDVGVQRLALVLQPTEGGWVGFAGPSTLTTLELISGLGVRHSTHPDVEVLRARLEPRALSLTQPPPDEDPR